MNRGKWIKGKTLKVLFVNVVKNIPIQKSFYPLGFGYLVSYARTHGLSLKSLYAENLDCLREANPDVVAFSCITENFNLAKKYAGAVKAYNDKIRTLIGGVHISAVPDSMTENFDVAILGEGERTFYELAKNNFEPARNIAGLYYDGTKTADRDLIEPLDDIPFPERRIYRLGDRGVYTFTSRGCPYRCYFCSSSRFWKRVRLHSAEYVAAELRELRINGAKHIQIFDDTFLLNLDRVKAIRDYIKGSGLTFAAALRANQVTDEVVSVLKDMGVCKVGMGLESNSYRVLQWLNKGNTPEINQKAVDALRRGGLDFSASFIYGTPVEDATDLKITYDFIKRNKIEFDMYRLMKYPNTPLYDGNRDWDSCRIRMKHRGFFDVWGARIGRMFK